MAQVSIAQYSFVTATINFRYNAIQHTMVMSTARQLKREIFIRPELTTDTLYNALMGELLSSFAVILYIE